MSHELSSQSADSRPLIPEQNRALVRLVQVACLPSKMASAANGHLSHVSSLGVPPEGVIEQKKMPVGLERTIKNPGMMTGETNV